MRIKLIPKTWCYTLGFSFFRPRIGHRQHDMTYPQPSPQDRIFIGPINITGDDSIEEKLRNRGTREKNGEGDRHQRLAPLRLRRAGGAGRRRDLHDIGILERRAAEEEDEPARRSKNRERNCWWGRRGADGGLTRVRRRAEAPWRPSALIPLGFRWPGKGRTGGIGD